PLLVVTLSMVVPVLSIVGQAPPTGSVTIGRRDSVTSRILKETRKLLVYTPPSYNDTTYLPRRYPVLYLLDGDAHFHSVTGLLQILGTGVNGTFVLPEMIVVAIPNTDRTRDLTPTHVLTDLAGKPSPAFKTSGGMPNFLQFIQTELIPHIESTYRTMPYRVFIGHSLGGITTINALYTVPQLFNAYVAIDPSLWWDNRTLLKQAKAHVDKPGLAGRALFVGQANTINADDTTSNQHFDSIIQFNAILEAHNQSGLRYAYKYYPHDDHGSVPMIAEYDALRFIFAAYRGNIFASLERPAYLTEHFARISESLGVRFDPPESMVDLLGNLEMARDTTKAIALFTLNTDLYPASPNAWGSLAKAQLTAADTSQAIAALQRVLALKPGQPAATDLLKKVGARRQ
ncbi:MAG: alpha/beta hydrolase-fold protein, partial [Gemmatimonadota bacterium]